MSTTGSAVVTEVFRLLQAPTEADHLGLDDAVEQAVNRQAALIAQQLGLASQWITSAVPVVAGTRDYTLSSSYEYASVAELKFADDGARLRRVPEADILAQRDGGDTYGRATEYCLHPTTTQGLEVWLNNIPSASENIDALVSVVPETWDANGETSPTIPFSIAGCRALELLVAAAVGVTLNAEKLTALGLNPESFADWRAEAHALIAGEKLKIIRLKRRYGPNSYDVAGEWAYL